MTRFAPFGRTAPEGDNRAGERAKRVLPLVTNNIRTKKYFAFGMQLFNLDIQRTKDAALEKVIEVASH